MRAGTLRGVTRRLVLWDVDYTLIDAGGFSGSLYAEVFRGLFGRELTEVARMSGRTDRAIITETLAQAGVAEPDHYLEAFIAGLAAAAPEFRDRLAARGRVLPGATEALAALADGGRMHAVQSVLTGNIRPLAELKLSVLGLARHLDLDIGAYGDDHAVRAELVGIARDRAAAACAEDFSGQATVLVGDTPLDIDAALSSGARAVGVATGPYPAAELAAAGAHAVLPSLADTQSVLSAILC
jgi:phosphoglycolate phosphatase